MSKFADPDHDRVPNFFEYIFGTDPSRASVIDDCYRIVIVEDGDLRYLEMSFRQTLQSLSQIVLPKHSVDLLTWSNEDFLLTEDTNDGTYRWRTYRYKDPITSTNPVRFITLEAEVD
ncbi:hypothetical protein QEH59_18830, partial [Coraliomargarita sp. SDUM461004]